MITLDGAIELVMLAATVILCLFVVYCFRKVVSHFDEDEGRCLGWIILSIIVLVTIAGLVDQFRDDLITLGYYHVK